jgi:hypothetical protein
MRTRLFYKRSYLVGECKANIYKDNVAVTHTPLVCLGGNGQPPCEHLVECRAEHAVDLVATPQVFVSPPVVLKRGRGRPLTHGAYSKYTLKALTTQKINEIYSILEGERLATAPSDKLYVTMLGRMLAQLETLDRWFEVNGYLKNAERGEPWPAVQHYLNLVKQTGHMLEALGMTPTARSRLGRNLVETEDIASKILSSRGE